jgi:hypothetical protein
MRLARVPASIRHACRRGGIRSRHAFSSLQLEAKSNISSISCTLLSNCRRTGRGMTGATATRPACLQGLSRMMCGTQVGEYLLRFGMTHAMLPTLQSITLSSDEGRLASAGPQLSQKRLPGAPKHLLFDFCHKPCKIAEAHIWLALHR